jgi:hypothetical protein
MKPHLLLLFTSLAVAAQAAPAPDDNAPDPWPRVFVQGGGTNIVYQPQVDSWDGYFMKARAAVSIQPAGVAEPTFGVIELSARTLVDKVQRTVTLDDILVNSAKFPSAPDKEAAYLAQLQKIVPDGARTISLDRLEANLAIVDETKKGQAVPIKNSPPQIIVSQQPALLVLIDGQPAWRPVTGTRLQRVINTRVLLLQDSAGQCYLRLWDGFLQAPSLNGPWSVAKNVTGDMKTAMKAAADSQQVDLLPAQEDPNTKKTPTLKSTAPPVIYTATGPAELLLIDGNPNWTTINGSQLLYVANTANDIFKNLNDQQTYIVISGRWFRAPSLNGPWEYVPGASLPPDFASMPDTSPKENVKASIPGTAQAQEMRIANSIPQTAQIKRDAKLDQPPQIDGAPQLQPVPETSLSYVANSPTPIIRVSDTSWFLCQNGVWFTAASVNGPWMVATAVPPVIYSIPPSSPIYYVTYCRISSVTPTVVYFGYTPGYMGSVVNADGVVVYGTGYYYTPWVGTVYVTPPVTYGYCAVPSWTPWAGWAFGFSVGWAVGSSGWYAGWYRPPPPCWGPYWGYWHGGAYRTAWGGAAVWGPGGWAATSGNIYHQWGSWSGVSRVSGGYNAWTGNAWSSQYGHSYNSRTGTIAAGQRGAVQNVYTGNYAYGGRGAAYNPYTGNSVSGGKVTVGNSRTGNEATAGRVTVNTPGPGSTTISGVKTDNGGVYKAGNQVVAGKDGNVYRYNGNNNGWQQTTSSGWQNVQNTQQAQSLQRESQARDWGQQRSDSYSNFRANTGSAQRGGGSFRGGGGRR